MVITVLEAHVPAEKAAILQETFQSAIEHLDAGIAQTFLLHGLRDADLWQIVTLWESRAALDAMRQSGETPRGVLIFRTAFGPGCGPGRANSLWIRIINNHLFDNYYQSC